MRTDTLSILIPCYRCDPAPLVEALLPQLQALAGISWEIIVGNDHSGQQWQDTFDAMVRLHPEVRVLQPDHNLGRAAIRNYMAKNARFNLLLFIDADSLPVSKEYIQTYLAHAHEADVLVGGTAYKPFPGCRDSLRYCYGIKREAIPAAERNKEPYHRIALNNVLAHKQVWDHIPLNEDILGYGHEDTYWGLALEWAGKSIRHLDNPVYHTGLEYNETFISKSKEGAANLAHLVGIGLIPAESAKLASLGEKLLTHKALKGILLGMRLAHNRLNRLAVQSGSLSLRALDLLKLEAYLNARVQS